MQVVINHKTTKFESNSQHNLETEAGKECCYQSQNYKIWKQFTTWNAYHCTFARLLSITKLQNLKAIHNTAEGDMLSSVVVINHKTTKFESNSQQIEQYIKEECSCYQSQNYKIWKQFTTRLSLNIFKSVLLSITKLQNLKAIHNQNDAWEPQKQVVINHKTTKFESNSQRIFRLFVY